MTERRGHDPEAATLPTGPTEDPVVDLARRAVLEGEGFEGRYEDLRLLGKGGMGEVRLCRDMRFGRDVAVKVLRKGRASGPFLREAVIQGQLEHPAIVPVYDLGARGEQVYFAMKRVRGVTLRDVVGEEREARKAGLPPQRSRRSLLAAIAHVCLSVDYAHEKGVVHCDLKPGNVMLGDFGEVYVLDWGVARLATGGDDAERPPASGGTPGYMAPEQATGGTITARTDVYALGAILFELLTLTRLHDGSTEERLKSTTEGADATILARFPELDVAPELEAICVRATAKDPAARFATARELHDALERYLDGDRDLERRKELSDGSVREAERAFERANAGGDGSLAARTEALRAVGRALALAPENAAALDLFARLVAEPPKTLPAEAERELALEADASERTAARRGAGGYVAMLAGFVTIASMGVRQWVPALLHLALTVAAGAMSWQRSRGKKPPSVWRWETLGVGLLASAMLSRVFGPLLVAPGIASTVGVAFAVYVRGRGRIAVIAITSFAILVPALLELAGVLPQSVFFEHGALLIPPQMTGFPPIATSISLAFIALACVALPAILVGRTSDAFVELKRRYFVREWQLRQLVPQRGGASPRGAQAS